MEAAVGSGERLTSLPLVVSLGWTKTSVALFAKWGSARPTQATRVDTLGLNPKRCSIACQARLVAISDQGVV